MKPSMKIDKKHNNSHKASQWRTLSAGEAKRRDDMKKITMIALSVLMAVTVFAACGSNGGDPTPGGGDVGALTDGTYTGEGTGHNGTIEVSVTVANGYISAVDVLDHQETEAIFADAWADISTAVVGRDSVDDVDTVTGATVSAEGILEAIQDAISKAN